MNILIVTRYNNGGGVVTHVINLANELMNRGNKVVVAAPYDMFGSEGRYKNLECIYIPINFESKNPIGIIRKLCKIIERYNIQIIHSHNRNTSLYAKFFKIIKNIPFVWTLHQNNIPTKFPYKTLTFPGDRTIVVSSELKEFCVEKLGIPDKKLSIIYNGVYEDKYIIDKDTNNIKKKYGVQPEEKVIALLSRLERRKGHMMLLRALVQLKKKEKLRVLITGTDIDNGEYRQELEKYIKDNNLDSIVSFVGYVNPVEILSICDVMVLPSKREGQPIAITEAFLMKVPVIRTKTGGYEDTKDFCIGIDNEEQLATGIEKILEKNNDLKNMVEAAYAFAKNNCTVNGMTEQVQKIYKELI